MKKYTGKIENMPMGATLTGIVVEEAKDVQYRTYASGLYYKVVEPAVISRPYTLKPNKIEVHDDVIVLMYWHFGVSVSQKAPPCEVNIKIGTLVEWEI